jgi:hypothetical protein
MGKGEKMDFITRQGLDVLRKQWQDAKSFILDKFSRKEPHQVSLAAVILMDTEDYIKALIVGQRCTQCQSSLVFDVCDVCGEQVIGCMHCHLEAHVMVEEVTSIILQPEPVVHKSDSQYYGEDVDDALDYFGRRY